METSAGTFYVLCLANLASYRGSLHGWRSYAGFFLLLVRVGALLASDRLPRLLQSPSQVAVFVASSILMVFSTRTLLKTLSAEGNSAYRSRERKWPGNVSGSGRAREKAGDKAAIKYAGIGMDGRCYRGEAPAGWRISLESMMR